MVSINGFEMNPRNLQLTAFQQKGEFKYCAMLDQAVEMPYGKRCRQSSLTCTKTVLEEHRNTHAYTLMVSVGEQAPCMLQFNSFVHV